MNATTSAAAPAEQVVMSSINADPSAPVPVPTGLEASLNRIASQFQTPPSAAAAAPAPTPAPAPATDPLHSLTAMLAGSIFAGLMYCRNRPTDMNMAYAFAKFIVDKRHAYADGLSDEELGILDMFATNVAFATFSSSDYTINVGITPDNVWAQARVGVEEHRRMFGGGPVKS